MKNVAMLMMTWFLLAGCLSSTPKQATSSATRGTVLKIDQEWNFLLLDVGRKHGVTTNTVFLIRSGAKPGGRVRVTDVKDSMSVAKKIDRWYMYRNLREGDPIEEITEQ